MRPCYKDDSSMNGTMSGPSQWHRHIGINGHIWVWITIAGASVLDYGRAELGFQAQRVAGSDNVSLSKPRQRSCCAPGRFRASRSIGQTQFLHICRSSLWELGAAGPRRGG